MLDGDSGSFPPLRMVEVNGAKLAYREVGDGLTVVFVHGAISDLRTWDEQLSLVSAEHRAIAYLSKRLADEHDSRTSSRPGDG